MWPRLILMDKYQELPMELTTTLPVDEIAHLFHGTQWTRTRVWRAAIVALQYLEQQHLPISNASVLDTIHFPTFTAFNDYVAILPTGEHHLLLHARRDLPQSHCMK
jgi:hypothetical protein